MNQFETSTTIHEVPQAEKPNQTILEIVTQINATEALLTELQKELHNPEGNISVLRKMITDNQRTYNELIRAKEDLLLKQKLLDEKYDVHKTQTNHGIDWAGQDPDLLKRGSR
jgi:chromosome segregation ATPase